MRRFALLVHLVFSIGWIGAILAYLALVALAWNATDAHTVRAGWLAMERVGTAVLIPLGAGTLLTGLALALGTSWGLFRHYWVLLTFLLTLLAFAVLVQHMATVRFYAARAAEATQPTREGLAGEFLHAGGGLFVLLVVHTLNVYKPRGLTRYGRRMRDRAASPETQSL